MAVAMAVNGYVERSVIHRPIAPPVPSDYYENGRLYHGWRRETYMLPCDEKEKERLDICHEFFTVARRKQLHSAPFTPNYDGPRILDLGCGTGIWAIDMADKYRNAEVLGIDISLIQPATIPPNLSFRQRDFEAPWNGMSIDSWDMIHLRMLLASVTNWAEMYQKVFRHLKPGYGWMEQVEMDFFPRCDDGSLPEDAAIFRWGRHLVDAADRHYKPITYNQHTRHLLERTGFVDISEQVIRVPMNDWPADAHQKDIGRWYYLIMEEGLEAMTLAPLTRMSGWTKGQVDDLVAQTLACMKKKAHHVYCTMHIWTARRPGD